MPPNKDVKDLGSLQFVGDDWRTDVNWVGPGPTQAEDNADLMLAQAAPEVIWCSYSPPKKAKTFFEKAKTEKNDDGDFQNHSLKYFFFKSVKTLHTLITETDMESG